jgi:RIO-like serine/threonine protein kinase
VYIAPKIKLREGWFMGFQEAFVELAKDPDLQGENYRVLFYLFGNLGFENYIAIPQRQIAEALKMQKSHVSEAIKVLVDKQILLEGPKLGRTHTYRLSNLFGWKGSVKNLSKMRNQKTGNVITLSNPTDS